MAMSPSDAIINFNPDISKNKHKHNLVKLVQNMNDTRNPFFLVLTCMSSFKRGRYSWSRLSQQRFLLGCMSWYN